MTLPAWLSWLLFSDAGLALRVLVGVAIFALLAWLDFRRHGRAARRWREYLFLGTVTLVGVIYGAINDLITSSLSWEYFYYGKGLAQSLGSRVPPDRLAVSLAAMGIGAKAAGAATLVSAAMLLIANNPSPRRPSLSYSRLSRLVVMMFLVMIGCELLIGTIGFWGRLTWGLADLRWVASEPAWRPGRFLGVFALHLGAYVGGIVGSAVALVSIVRQRARSQRSTGFQPVFS